MLSNSPYGFVRDKKRNPARIYLTFAFCFYTKRQSVLLISFQKVSKTIEKLKKGAEANERRSAEFFKIYTLRFIYDNLTVILNFDVRLQLAQVDDRF